MEPDEELLETTPAPEAAPEPAPWEERLKSLETTLQELVAKTVPEPAPAPEPVEETYDFDPKTIVNAAKSQAAQSAMSAVMTLRNVENELRKEFGDQLEEDELRGIIDMFANANVDPAGLHALAEKKTHIGIANSVVGEKYRAGKLNKPKPTVVTPVGGGAPVETDDFMDLYKKTFGEEPKTEAAKKHARELKKTGGSFI